MKTKFRYEPPLLVDMRGASLCGAFSTCGSGYTAGGGLSCAEYSRCKSGSYTEYCMGGSGACGCDSCCENGSNWTTSSGFPFMNCECYGGSQAAGICNDGMYTGAQCVNGNAAGDSTCLDGTTIYFGGGTQWCGSGSD
jgi:hypothetical protein